MAGAVTSHARRRALLAVVALLAVAPGCGLATSGTATEIDDTDAAIEPDGAAGSGGSAGAGGAGGSFADASDARVDADGAGGSDASADVASDAIDATDGATDGAADVTSEPDAPAGEDCLNGVDDDGDGLVDCEDPLCLADYECVDEAPTGWAGYFRVVDRAYADPSSACPGGGPPIPVYAEPAGAPSCAPCTCGDLGGVQCPTPSVSCWNGSIFCGFPASEQKLTSAETGACVKPSGGSVFGTSCSLTSGTSPTSNGSCAPSATGLLDPSPWARTVDVCGDQHAGGGCGKGRVCIPIGVAPYDSSECITRTGSPAACPTGWEGSSIDGYGSATDTRACSACTCTPKAACDVGYSFYDADGCTYTPGMGFSDNVEIHDGNCHDVSGLTDQGTWSLKLDPPVASGSCTPSGGDPTGAVTPKEPITVCCR